MKISYKHTITVNNTRYPYLIESSSDKRCVFFVCKAAGIAQDFLKEDVAALLVDLPEMILEEIEYKSSQDNIIRFRVSSEEKKKIVKKASKKGYRSVSMFLRDLALKA